MSAGATSLSIETLNDAINAFAGPPDKFPVGIALSPYTEASLRRQMVTPGPFDSIMGVPFIIDSRLPWDRNEAYYDRATWDARCKEQREYDAR